MGIDKNTEGKPVVHLERRATKVNLSMIVGVVLFFILGVIGLVRLHHQVPGHGETVLPSDRPQSQP
jgi:hypothetical protein